MTGIFGKVSNPIVRAAAAAMMLAVVGAFLVGPMGCGSAGDSSPLPVDDPTGGSSGSGSGSGSGGTADASKDALDPTTIHWDAQTNPTNYKIIQVNFKIDQIDPSSPAPTVCWSWNRPSNWPKASNGKSVGNNWVIAKVNGEWHATPWEHVPPTDASCRTTEARSGQPPFVQGFGAIASSWYPKSGEEVYWMNSIICRGPVPGGSPQERTPIVRFNWP